MVTYNEAKNRVQRNDESTGKNISFLEKKAWGYFLKFAKLTKIHRKVDPARNQGSLVQANSRKNNQN